MALTIEQKELRRKIIMRNTMREDADAFFDRMMGDEAFCLEQLGIWAEVFADEEIANLRRQAEVLKLQADELERARLQNA